jgi:MFS family permease
MISSPSVWTVMLALLGVHLAGMGVFLAVPVLAPAIAAEAGIPAALAGVHTALVYAGALISGPLAGAFIRRLGGMRVLQLGLAVCGGALALSVVAHPLALAVSALACGLGHGPVTPAGSHLLAQRTPANRRSLIFSLKQCGVPAGAMLIAAVTPLIAQAYGWRAGILAVAAFLLASAAGLQPLRGALDADRDRSASLANLRSVWASALGSLAILRHLPVLRRLTMMSALYGISQFCFSAFFVVFQVEALGVPLTEAGFRLALAQAAGVVGRVVWGVVADRVGAAPVLTGLGIAAAASGTALLLAGPDWPERRVPGRDGAARPGRPGRRDHRRDGLRLRRLHAGGPAAVLGDGAGLGRLRAGLRLLRRHGAARRISGTRDGGCCKAVIMG